MIKRQGGSRGLFRLPSTVPGVPDARVGCHAPVSPAPAGHQMAALVTGRRGGCIACPGLLRSVGFGSICGLERAGAAISPADGRQIAQVVVVACRQFRRTLRSVARPAVGRCSSHRPVLWGTNHRLDRSEPEHGRGPSQLVIGEGHDIGQTFVGALEPFDKAQARVDNRAISESGVKSCNCELLSPAMLARMM